jgi:hypothetical protein
MLDFIYLLVRVVGHVSPSIDNQVLKSYMCAILMPYPCTYGTTE